MLSCCTWEKRPRRPQKIKSDRPKEEMQQDKTILYERTRSHRWNERKKTEKKAYGKKSCKEEKRKYTTGRPGPPLFSIYLFSYSCLS